MAATLIDQLMNEFGDDTLSHIGSALGESTVNTQTALSGMFPALITALANLASTPEGLNQLLEQIRQGKLDSAQFADIAGAIEAPDGLKNIMNIGRPLVDLVFGNRTNAVTDWISSLSGISRTSSSSLLSLGLPAVLAMIGRRAGPGVTASDLLSLLSDQRASLKYAPAGLSVAVGAPFVGPYVAAAKTATTAARPIVGAYENAPPPATAWWKWTLPLLALAALLGYFLVRREETPTSGTSPVTLSADTGTRARTEPGSLGEKRLPNGMVLNYPSGGVEARLLAFIEDPNPKVDKATWFSFDRLEFETDSAQLRPTSQEQLRNIAEILKAYPQVNVKIGGYTDNMGDDAYNMKLSYDRATNTMHEIVALGIDRSRLEAEGYGKQFPVADNATDEGRQRNRRIDIRVTGP